MTGIKSKEKRTKEMKLYCRCLNVCIEIFGEIKGDSSTNYPGEWLYEVSGFSLWF